MPYYDETTMTTITRVACRATTSQDVAWQDPCFFPLEMYPPEPGWLQMRIVLFAIFGHSMGFCDNAGITTSVRNFPRNKGLFHMLKGRNFPGVLNSGGCRLNHVNSLQFTIVDSDGEMSNY